MIYILAYYGDMNPFLLSSPAADTIVRYLVSKIEPIYSVSIVSPVKKQRDYKSFSNPKNIVLPPWNFQTKFLFLEKLDTIARRIWAICYILRNMKSGDKLIVYHSLASISAIKIFKRFKNNHLCLLFLEVYGDVKGRKEISEREVLISRLADSYIFSNHFLNEKINKEIKPYIILHGTYSVEKDRCYKFNDGKIHVVYAGTLDRCKGGARAAIEAAEFLDENYHVHILGFGGENEKNELLKFIEKMKRKTPCSITYEGLKRGEEYIAFIQSCDIGLSTQDPSASFNDTSFPSKVLSYLSNGLRVVSVRLKILELSNVASQIYFYDENIPFQIASTIKKVNLDEVCDSRGILKKMDREFMVELLDLLKK